MGSIQGPSGQLDVALSSPELEAEYDAAGVKVLWSSAVTTRSFLMCTKPITSLADAKGKRVVVSGRTAEQETLAAGMVPVSLPVVEWYEGLQRGVADCVSTTPGGVTGTGVWDVAKHVVYTDFLGSASSSVLVNKEAFEGMPLEAQQVVWDALDTWVAERVSLSLRDSARVASEGKDKHGLQFHIPDASLLKAVHDRQTASLAELIAAPPKGISDPQAFVDRTAAVWDKWETLLSEELAVPLVTEGDRTQAEIDAANIDIPKLAALLEEHAYGPHRP
jgi:TRAP-type C4-dicarboxylate transport system substrate-binding protein